jgi:hypothetical protein
LDSRAGDEGELLFVLQPPAAREFRSANWRGKAVLLGRETEHPVTTDEHGLTQMKTKERGLAGLQEVDEAELLLVLQPPAAPVCRQAGSEFRFANWRVNADVCVLLHRSPP